jgi:outer membrane immunogenic protein
MKKIIPGLAAFAVILASGPSDAADMPVKALSTPAPAYVWTGCYVGANVGVGSARKDFFDPLGVPPADNLGGHVATGIVGGGQIGCDYQLGAWVIGLQGMFDAADLRERHLAFGDFYESRVHWFATATARVGYLFMPNLLGYVKGGAAWVRDEQAKIDFVTGLDEGREHVTRNGWTVGVGAEVLFARNWSLFAEFNHMDFGTRRINFKNLEVPPVPPTFPLDITQRVETFLAGINYRFGVPGL